jgi:pectinesterase
MNLRSGRQYFENCYIEGEVDFICGGATPFFNNCHIHSLAYKEGGYITLAAYRIRMAWALTMVMSLRIVS